MNLMKARDVQLMNILIMKEFVDLDRMKESELQLLIKFIRMRHAYLNEMKTQNV